MKNTTTKPNVVEEFFVPVNKIKKNEEPIPELVRVPQPPDPAHPNPKVAEWIANVKKRERK